MILGIYWYYEFPDLLYSFRYFSFNAGTGGAASGPPSLTLCFNITNAANFVKRIKQLGNEYPDCSIFMTRRSDNVKISIGYYTLLDFDFQIAQYIEQLLDKEKISNYTFLKDHEEESIRIVGVKRERSEDLSKLKVFKTYALRPETKYNYQIFAIGFSCEILKHETNDFLEKLRLLTIQNNIEELYYYKGLKTVETDYLSIFFTNRRQGNDLQPLNNTNINEFENEIQDLQLRFSIRFNVSYVKTDSFRHYLLRSNTTI